MRVYVRKQILCGRRAPFDVSVDKDVCAASVQVLEGTGHLAGCLHSSDSSERREEYMQ